MITVKKETSKKKPSPQPNVKKAIALFRSVFKNLST